LGNGALNITYEDGTEVTKFNTDDDDDDNEETNDNDKTITSIFSFYIIFETMKINYIDMKGDIDTEKVEEQVEQNSDDYDEKKDKKEKIKITKKKSKLKTKESEEKTKENKDKKKRKPNKKKLWITPETDKQEYPIQSYIFSFTNSLTNLIIKFCLEISIYQIYGI